MALFEDPYSEQTLKSAHSTSEAGEDRVSRRPPPTTCVEWLNSSSGAGHLVSTDGTLFVPSAKDQGTVKWPIHPPHLNNLVTLPTLSLGEENKTTSIEHECLADTILGTQEEIEEDLRKHAPWNQPLWDELEERLQQLEFDVSDSAEIFAQKKDRSNRASLIDGLANLTFMTEVNDELLSIRKDSMDAKKGWYGHGNTVMDDYKERLKDMAKTNADEMDNLLAGLSEKPLLVPLPGKLDALAILDLVHSAAKIPTHLMETWKKLFFCKECVGILQNAFWWMWLDFFKPKKWMQCLLFNQIADDFVLILNKMEGKYKDEVFMRFPVYLAQALYSTFCQAFPSSNKEFNTPKFLDYLCSTMSEWILGVQSQPRQWESWPRHVLNPYFLSLSKDKEKVKATKPYSEDTMPSLTEEDMMTLSRHLSRTVLSKMSSSSGSVVKMADPYADTRLEVEDSFSTDESLISNFSLSKLEKGPIFECVRFNVYGRSPLLQHYLYHHHLTDSKKTPGFTISRTQIKEFPSHRYTYKQVVTSQKRKADRLYQQYKSQIALTEHGIAIEKSKNKPR